MPKYVVIEELHLTVLVPADLPAKAARKMRQILGGRLLARRLARETREACGRVKLPRPIKVRVTK